MNKKRLFERVLGAVLVLAFGFILYSAFLDSGGSVYVDRSTQIPVPSRSIEPLPIEETAIAVEVPEKTAASIFIPEQEVSSEQALQASTIEQGVPNAWVIQVGSFSSLEKADEVTNQLIEQSYKAYHRKLSTGTDDSKQLFRVLVGPYMNAEEAVRHQREVDQMLELSTLLMKFEP